MEIVLIEIKQGMRGFETFIGSWLCLGKHKVLIDVGPANSADYLIEALKERGVGGLDYILLTHMHLDHSGGLAKVLTRYPTAKVICHEKGLKYLEDPAVLWQGSLKVLGSIAEGYGEPCPVPRDRLVPHTKSDLPGLSIIETPGHAAHHLSFCYGGRLFPGEAGGNYLVFGNGEYMRPATPPRFYYETFLNSLDLLINLKDQPICFAHFGSAPSSRILLRRFKNQLQLWKDVISDEMKKVGDEIEVRCVERLIKIDPDLRAYGDMPPFIRERERALMKNSVKGFIGYLRLRSVESD